MTTPADNNFAPDRPLEPLPGRWRSFPRVFFHVARENWSKPAIGDSTKANYTFGETLIRSLAMGRVLSRILGPEPNVGILLPPMAPTVLANIALSLWGKTTVNLNYTASDSVINASLAQAGIRQIITSDRALARFGIKPDAELIKLEDLPAKVTKADKVWAAAVAKVVPIPLLGMFLPGMRGDSREKIATVIFTSGSTGEPKGVMLSHGNLLSNVHGVSHQLRLKPDDKILGVLPLFHSTGYTVTLWMALCLGKTTIFHYSPLDARIVGDLCQTHKLTIVVVTPTFARMYAHKCKPEQFDSVRLLVLGGEKLKPELERDLRERMKVEPLEGYGTTELSPVVAVNIGYEVATPDGRRVHGNQPGTVGQPLPGTSIKTVDPDTGADLPRGEEGLVCVKGPQVMAGYLNQPEATAQAIRDGWYNTGDLGYHDADGFLHITDRLSRFSKLAGEMVPHVKVESAIMEVAGVDELKVAVTGIPDEKRGERLAVLFTDLGLEPGEIIRRLNESGLPKLWIPSPDDFRKVDTIPVLGTGKIDLRKLKQLALHRGEVPV